MEKESEQASESVEAVLTQQTLIRLPHRHTIEWLSETGCISLSSALYIWLPAALRKFPLTAFTRQQVELFDSWRSTAAESAQRKQQLALTPSHRPQSSLALQKKFGDRFVDLFSLSTPKEELMAWFGILKGELQVIVGRERGIFAPFLNLRHILINEPEDIAYYHDQLPYLSLVDAGKKVGTTWSAQTTLKSHVPQAAATLLWGEHCLGAFVNSKPQIVDLRKEDILNEALITSLKALSPSETALLLYNAHDRLIKKEGDAVQVAVPGIETLRKQLAKALGTPILPPHIILDTRAMFSHLHTNVRLTAALNINPLLEPTNFADTVHGWSDVGRLLSYPGPCFIQTHNVANPLVHSLQNARFAEYCEEQLRERKTNHLPPFATTVVCSLPVGDGTEDTVKKVYDRLIALLKESSEDWHLTHPFPARRRKQDLLNIMLYSEKEERLSASIFRYLALLKRPWKVQRNPWHIM